jgi:hypothetical protein
LVIPNFGSWTKQWCLFVLSNERRSSCCDIEVSLDDPYTLNVNVGHQPYYTKDNGASWQLSNGVKFDQYTRLGSVGTKRALDGDKVNDGTFYLVTYDGTGVFYVSTDGGANYSREMLHFMLVGRSTQLVLSIIPMAVLQLLLKMGTALLQNNRVILTI